MKDTDFIKFENQRLMLKTWAKKKGLRLSLLKSRLMRGWELERAMNTPAEKKAHTFKRTTLVPRWGEFGPK